jgi:FtsP/CotA-like multicopper oxidase with cupredoxin domain
MRSDVFYGQVQYQLDPLLWTQPEGTHWYHPHKHGSVSLQVTNGMAGPLIVEGPFDDWLQLFYGWKLKEKILVIQQVEPGTNLYGQGASALGPLPTPLINGQVQPTVTMRPGEVQRWRFVNATLSSLSQLNVQFPPGATVRQIAMDGVRFAPENYDRQPLFNDQGTFQIAPGNRADFLVQAPLAAGNHPVTHRRFGHFAERRRARAEAHDEALAPGPAEPALVTIRVEPAEAPAATGFPDKDVWPPMPSYLKDIQPDEVQGTVNLSFNMSHPKADPRAEFNISGVKFDGSCVNVTTTLGTALEWNVQNTTDPLHPFHIHINPFQVIRNAGRTYTPPYVWQDTIPLPSGSVDAPASVLLRHRYTDFTGEYVLHCHFLGHEDRGMMYAVQTVCPKDPGSFGKARPGGQPECVEGNLIEASPKCPAILITPRK